MARGAAGGRGALEEPAGCPRATLAFVGREAELARIGDLLDEEVLFLIYGVAGIGKTELAYRALEVARERPGWRGAVPTLVQIQPEMTEQHLVAVLRRRTGADAGHADRLGGGARSLAEELEPVVHALDARRRLLFLDDLHLIDRGVAARVLGHLARHMRASRLFAASRLEIPVVSVGVTPVVTRLAPLEEGDARRMLDHLGRRLGLPIQDVSGILRRAGGSPFFLQREVASSLADESPPAADRLESTLKVLPLPARRLLLRASVIVGRATVAELSTAAPIQESLALLARHFFVEVADGTVAIHDLVREAALRLATPLEILRARRAAARVFTQRAAVGGPEAPLAAVEAAHQLGAAGDHAAALALITEWHGVISGAGLDHLLRDTLQQIRAALPAEATSIDLLLARTLVRRGLMAEAQEVLARARSDPRVAGSVRYLTLAGTIASQRGDLRTAEICMQGAHEAAKPDTAGSAERARVALHLADVLSLRGETARARAILGEVRPICETIGRRTLLRWGWSLGLSWVFDEEFTSAIETVAPFRELAAEAGASDLAAQLTMLEVLSKAELHDAVAARELTDRIVAPAAHAGALRAPLASFYVGLAAWAEGDLRRAEVALRESWTFLRAHHSEIVGLIVGHYLARVHLDLGDVPAAEDLFARSTRRAVEIGLEGIRSFGEVHHARALVAAGDLRAARALAERVLVETPAPGRGAQAHVKMRAHQALALTSAHEGDLPAARRHIEAALDCAAGEPAPRCDTLLVRAEVELCGGEPSVAVQDASAARGHYAGLGRRFWEAHACVTLAAGHAALGGPGDLAMAEEALVRAGELAAQHGYEALRLRIVLVRSAALCRVHGRAAADRLLGEALAQGAGRPGVLELLLVSALGSRRDRELPAGLAAHLVLLGFSPSPAPPPPAEVTVDLAASTIASRHGVVKGRPVACALLACLVESQGRVVPAEVLYRTVWGAGEYHPLRHRNMLYVAVNRLRRILADLCPDRRGEIIETLPGGWRLVAGVAARQTE